MGADLGFLVSPAVLITAVALTLTVMTGLAARILLLLQDLAYREAPQTPPGCCAGTGLAHLR